MCTISTVLSLSYHVVNRAYKALRRLCDIIFQRTRETKSSKMTKQHWWEPALCAFCCAPAVLFMRNEWYNSFAMYTGTRAAQGLYNWAKLRSRWHFWGSSWAHGDSLLFAYGTAQIMYAFSRATLTRPPSITHPYLHHYPCMYCKANAPHLSYFF